MREKQNKKQNMKVHTRTYTRENKQTETHRIYSHKKDKTERNKQNLQ